jgi:hypothetical protein
MSFIFIRKFWKWRQSFALTLTGLGSSRLYWNVSYTPSFQRIAFFRINCSSAIFRRHAAQPPPNFPKHVERRLQSDIDQEIQKVINLVPDQRDSADLSQLLLRVCFFRIFGSAAWLSVFW